MHFRARSRRLRALPPLGRRGWSLAWRLAAEPCERFHASQGLVPHVILKEGLGYYGIQLDRVDCRVHGPRPGPLVRLTMAGEVENWGTGDPGDHGLKLEGRVSAGEPLTRGLQGPSGISGCRLTRSAHTSGAATSAGVPRSC